MKKKQEQFDSCVSRDADYVVGENGRLPLGANRIIFESQINRFRGKACEKLETESRGPWAQIPNAINENTGKSMVIFMRKFAPPTVLSF